MSGALIQLVVLAAVALFLIFRLRNVLGTRDGFEKPPVQHKTKNTTPTEPRRDFEVIDGGVDLDISDHVDVKSKTGKALAAMKSAEPSFVVGEFLVGARSAYEIILMAFEDGDLKTLRGMLSDSVYESFEKVVKDREAEGLTVESSFIGVRELKLSGARFDDDSEEADVTVRFVAELTSVVKDSSGEVVDGDPNAIKRQKDIWTFSRVMGSNDPNWLLVATGG